MEPSLFTNATPTRFQKLRSLRWVMTYAIFILFCSMFSLLLVSAGLHRVTGASFAKSVPRQSRAEVPCGCPWLAWPGLAIGLASAGGGLEPSPEPALAAAPGP